PACPARRVAQSSLCSSSASCYQTCPMVRLQDNDRPLTKRLPGQQSIVLFLITLILSRWTLPRESFYRFHTYSRANTSNTIVSGEHNSAGEFSYLRLRFLHPFVPGSRVKRFSEPNVQCCYKLTLGIQKEFYQGRVERSVARILP